MADYIISLDQGTTSSRAILFDKVGNTVAMCQKEFKQYFPEEAWVEHDPEEIWESTLEVSRRVIEKAKVKPGDVAAMGITNQRETTIVWNRKTGKAIYKAIVWQDRRTADYCDEIRTESNLKEIQAKTGLLIDPYFSATKIRWILENVDGARELAESGELLFGTVDTFLIWRLTKGKSHCTDATNASRTMIFNIVDQAWDESLLKLFNIPNSMLPSVKDCSDDFGVCDAEMLGEEIPIYGVAGDQQAALIGQACFSEGMAKSTYGTGCFMMLNTGERLVHSQHQLLGTVAYRLDGKVSYALEGSIFVAGAVVQWLRDGIKLISDAKETQGLANSVGYFSGITLVPAFTGLGAPYWDPNARGAITGITRDTGIAEIVTAALMSVGLQTVDLLKAMELDGAQFPSRLRIDGGMVKNDWLAQSLSDLMQLPVDRPSNVETTALGVAYLAGLKAGIYQSTEEISNLWSLDSSFEPELEPVKAEELHAKWKEEVAKVLS